MSAIVEWICFFCGNGVLGGDFDDGCGRGLLEGMVRYVAERSEKLTEELGKWRRKFIPLTFLK